MKLDAYKVGSKIASRTEEGLTTGVITSSRLRWNDLVYYVKVDEPITCVWRREPIDTLLVKHQDVEKEIV